MNKRIRDIFDLKEGLLWKCLYICVLVFVFSTSIINSIVWKNSTNLISKIFEYSDDICVLLSFILLTKEVLLFFISFKTSIKDKTNIAMFICVGVTYLTTLRKLYCVYVLLVFLAKYLNFRDLMKIFFFTKFSCIFIWILSYVVGLTKTVEFGEPGNSLGLSHYNDAAFQICYMFFSLWYLYLQDKKIISISLNILLILICLFVFRSRTPIVILAMFIILLLIKPTLDNDCSNNKIINFIYMYYPMLMMLFAVILGYFLNISGINIDGNFTSRFTEIPYSFRVYGIWLISHDTSETYMVFDNTYNRLINKLGMIFGIMSIYGMSINNKLIVKNKEIGLLILSILIYTYGQMEYVLKGELLLVIVAYMFCKDTPKFNNLENCEYNK